MKLHIYGGVQYIVLDEDEKICLATKTGDFIEVENKDNKLTTVREDNAVEISEEDESIKSFCPYCEKMVEARVDGAIPVRQKREVKGDYDVATVEDEVVYGFCPYCKTSLEVSRRYVRELRCRAR